MENQESNLNNLKIHPSQFLLLWFGVLIFVGATLLNLPFASVDGRSIGFVDALFTAASAVCVTGLTVVNTATHWTLFGKIIIVLLIQIGGLGIMTMATLIAFLFGKKITLKDRLLMQEEMNTTTLQGIVLLTKRVLFMTIGIEFIGVILLSFVFVPDYGLSQGIWFSIFHAISAFCNAGFDLLGNSMMDYVNNPLLNFTIISLLIIGGLGFYVLMDIIQRKKLKKLLIHSKIVLLISVALLIFGFLIVLIFEYGNPSTLGGLNLRGKLMSAMFLSATPRTAGFNTLDTAALGPVTTFFIIMLMFIGGSPGSTAGGVKTTTVGVVIIAIIGLVKGSEDTEIFKRRIPVTMILRAIAIIGIAFSLVILTTTILLVSEKNTGFSFIDIIFETVSAFGTVGLSRGLTPHLTDVGRIVVTLTMFVGRLGPLTIAFGIAQNQHKNKGYYKYPEGKIMVG
ncbi:MAG TPA: Trk family potassium uptake protein [Clostridiales bacterium]|jgi:trk system potassium uptake protein TrkH|nr:Trk family potassium uptake protein [Clostridiales bacterium]